MYHLYKCIMQHIVCIMHVQTKLCTPPCLVVYHSHPAVYQIPFATPQNTTPSVDPALPDWPLPPSHISSTYSSMWFKNWPALLVPPSSGLATTAWAQSGTFSLIHLKFDTSIMALYLFAKILSKKIEPLCLIYSPSIPPPIFSTHSHLTRQWRRAQHNPTQN